MTEHENPAKDLPAETPSAEGAVDSSVEETIAASEEAAPVEEVQPSADANEASGEDEAGAPLAEEVSEAELAEDLDEVETDAEPAPEIDPGELVPVLEAVLFASPTPVAPPTFRKVFGDSVPWETVRAGLESLAERCDEQGRGILLCEIAGGWQFLTREEHWPHVQRIAKVKHEDRLSPSAIETLSVVAYKQPVTRADVDAIRGVSSGALLRTLMDRGLVRVSGRAETPGHPFQYGTTPKFLQHFGLKSVRDLPDPRDLGRLLSEREGGAVDTAAEG